MSYEKELSEGVLRIGTKQTTKAVEQGRAAKVFVARDADPKLTAKIINLAKKTGVEVAYVDTMKQLGKACGIDVGTAMAAIENK
ncbi:ribosomal L7Ae/L30e/S12e/Gadd45 family protein [Paenibacillus thermotolerans]|uniref:ribosomal L7Ae/L30e/S12e/Gadd45 family protein n=1 Tax=Paenibacillus thermotolerans TaxID=3027807 RepID=UPI002368D3D3|nr:MULTISPECIES: ribosomal L7Ae/L30e/S12e/Gadd45 family protein [unclassified Paenibacillus]